MQLEFSKVALASKLLLNHNTRRTYIGMKIARQTLVIQRLGNGHRLTKNDLNTTDSPG